MCQAKKNENLGEVTPFPAQYSLLVNNRIALNT